MGLAQVEKEWGQKLMVTNLLLIAGWKAQKHISASDNASCCCSGLMINAYWWTQNRVP